MPSRVVYIAGRQGGPAAGIRTPDRPVSATRPLMAGVPSSSPPGGGVRHAGGLDPTYSRALCR